MSRAMHTECRGCGKGWNGYKPEHCTVCHETFGGTWAGDMHRTGEHGVRTGDNRRRCLTPAEMRNKGLTLNAHGLWVRSYGRSAPESLRHGGKQGAAA